MVLLHKKKASEKPKKQEKDKSAKYTYRKEIGEKGENFASHFLISLGFNILERNLRYGKNEIDIIAEKDGTIVFIEVKTRTTADFGYGEAAITEQKRKHIFSVARQYITEKKWQNFRFDALAVELDKDGSVQDIQHREDIFY